MKPNVTVSAMGLAILIAASSKVTFAQVGALRACLISPAASRIVVDGLMNEKAWETASELDNFSLLGGREEAVTQSVGRIVYDRDYLYLAVDCIEPTPQHLVAEHRNRDDPLWFDDCVEVFVSPNATGQPYYQFVVNSLGALFDSGGVNHGWNGKWTAAARVEKNSWTVEYAIPWRTLTPSRPGPGDVWRINVCRERQAGPPGSGKTAELSCWSTTFGQFHEPEHFGYALFTDRNTQSPGMTVLKRLASEHEGAAVRVSVPGGEIQFISPLGRAKNAIRIAREKVESQRQRIERTVRPPFADACLRTLREVDVRLDTLEAKLSGRMALSAPEGSLLCQQADGIVRDVDHLIWEAKFAELLEGELP